MDMLREIFSCMCGQDHLWTLGGVTLPCCQRCTGLYTGALFALLVVAVLRPRPGALLYWMHGAFMLAMFPFGFHLVEQGGLTRTFTGALFSFGLVYYLCLNPLSALNAWSDAGWKRMAAYLLLLTAALTLLLVALDTGGAGTARVLAGLETMGLGALLILAALNFVLLPATVRMLRAHPAGPHA